MGLGWVVRPPAAGGETIYDAYMREAGTTGRTEAEIARLQRWRREHNVMWVSELFRADGITLRDRFTTNLAARERRCEPDAIGTGTSHSRTAPRTIRAISVDKAGVFSVRETTPPQFGGQNGKFPLCS